MPFNFSFSSIPFPWAVLVALVVTGLAYSIEHFWAEVIEEEHLFLQIIAIFFVVYIGAAFAINALNPPLS